jgi:dolichol-phosphate mannosyltransferase
VSDDRVSDIYNLRFRSQVNKKVIASRENAWKALYARVIQKFIEPDMTVMDLGSGPGYFANQVVAKKVIAVDLDANNSRYLNRNVHFHNSYSQNLSFQESNTVDLVFSSNLFEHLGSSGTLLETLNEVNRVLKSNETSRLIVLMPNIRYVKWDFYNFVDHNLPLNENSLKEALEISNFEIIESHKRFFPYSANDVRIQFPATLIKIYLSLPPKLRPSAKQMFFVAKPLINKA